MAQEDGLPFDLSALRCNVLVCEAIMKPPKTRLLMFLHDAFEMEVCCVLNFSDRAFAQYFAEKNPLPTGAPRRHGRNVSRFAAITLDEKCLIWRCPSSARVPDARSRNANDNEPA